MKFAPQLILTLVAALFMVVGGAWATQREFEIFAWDRSSPAGTFNSVLEQSSLPVAVSSRRDLLLVCRSLLHPYYLSIEGEERAGRLVERCSTAANDIANEDGANSLAWALKAQLAARQANAAELNDALALSFATGKWEQWLAAIRFSIAEDNLSLLTPEVRANHDADILLMLNSRRALDPLVQRYVVDTAFRDRLVAVLETLSDERQRTFVSAVRRAAISRGNAPT